MRTLDQVVATTIRRYRGGEGIEDLADALGIKPGMLYRLSNPLDEEARINSKHLIPLMEKTRDYSILKHIAARLGFLCVRLPRVRSAREAEIADYQRRQAEAIRALLGFFAGERGQEDTLAAIRAELEAAAGWAKAVESHQTPSLFEEDPA
ncbi:MAG: phage regulatory CII family protein [Acidobacteriota bacterium]